MITTEQFTKAMEEAVAERTPNFRYPTEWRDDSGNCRYVHDNTPACLIGLALHRCGVSIETLREHEQEGAWVVLRNLGVDHAVAWAADDAQNEQDNDHTWGAALQAYFERLDA